MIKTKNQLNILLVESNSLYVRKFEKRLEKTNTRHKLYIISCSSEAIDFLYQRRKHHIIPHPDVILLDFNLPNNGGNKILRKIWNDKKLNIIPMVIFTTSYSKQEVFIPSMSNDSGYSLKPLTFKELLDIVKNIDDSLILISNK